MPWTKGLVLLLLLGIGATLLFGLYCILGPQYRVAYHVPIRHDDFLFSVERTRCRPDGELLSCLVRIHVTNEAKRVSFAWRPDIVYLTDDQRLRYGPVNDAALIVPPQSEVYTSVAFRVAPNSRHLTIHFWDGLFMGDLLNGAQYARMFVSLNP